LLYHADRYLRPTPTKFCWLSSTIKKIASLKPRYLQLSLFLAAFTDVSIYPTVGCGFETPHFFSWYGQTCCFQYLCTVMPRDMTTNVIHNTNENKINQLLRTLPKRFWLRKQKN